METILKFLIAITMLFTALSPVVNAKSKSDALTGIVIEFITLPIALLLLKYYTMYYLIYVIMSNRLNVAVMKRQIK